VADFNLSKVLTEVVAQQASMFNFNMNPRWQVNLLRW